MDNPFGVLEFLHWDHDWNSYKYRSQEDLEKAISLMKQAGIGWVRMDFLWEDIEPRQGEFSFEKYDRIVELLNANGISILGLLNYCAPWASACGKWNCPPRDHRLFLEYASCVAGRYKGKVKYWEVWNEPDSRIYWEPQDGLKEYASLLKETYRLLKGIDPECRVLNGGLAEGTASINNLYEQGAAGFFDILNLHYFDSPLVPGALNRVAAYPQLAAKIMARNGDADKKIWITEIGAPGVAAGIKVKNWWIGGNLTEEQQAKWLSEVFTKLLKDKKVEKVFWAFLRDCKNHWGDGTDYFGLVRWDFSRKPAYHVFERCVQDWRKTR